MNKEDVSNDDKNGEEDNADTTAKWRIYSTCKTKSQMP